ncbi:ribonuclease P protein subunit p25-like protein isoform X2 [Paroedura picta]|uniref:ribonuclease P protein subunit p25-like protein isoform X2 n=1 Tax=Paroedura picta TaxID=143630 RepID=UPI004056904F
MQDNFGTPANPLLCVTPLDGRKKYKQHIQEAFGSRWEQPIHLGTTVSLRQSYTDLLLTRTACLQERAHELMAMRWKHWEMEAHPQGLLQVRLESLFDSDAQRQSPRTVVLLGPAGGGKTSAMWKLMLDWASGKLWQERFDFVFYLPGGAVSRNREPLSVVDLVLGSCPAGTLLAEDVFANQDSLLVIVDGFEELQHPGLPGEMLSSDLHKKQAPEELVRGLLAKKLLPRSRLIVTSRPTALGALRPSLRSPQFVEVLGFRPAQREEYFHRFLGNQEEAAQTLETVQSNEALSGLCFLPMTCAIICSLVRRKPQSHLLKEIPEMATLTEIHMQLLFGILDGHSWLSNLEALCSLARDGVLGKRTVLDEAALKMHGLGGPDLEALSASGWVLHRDVFAPDMYKFAHLGFQEFLAALHFLLEKDGGSVSSQTDLNKVLGNQKEHGGVYSMLVRFLFGLSNARRLSALQDTWGCQTSRVGLLLELLKWVEGEAKQNSFRKPERLLELCHCVYEVEDVEFAKSVMGHVATLDLRDQLSTQLDFAALSFCLLAAEASRPPWLSGYTLGAAEIEQLIPGLQTSSDIQLNRCELSTATCEALTQALETNRGLSSLDLGENPLCDSGVIHLCDRLISSSSPLQRLRLNSCKLTAAACEALSRVLASNRSLAELDLAENHLGDLGVRQLCEGLKHPQSRLQRLTLHSCGLTAAACEDVASVVETSETLMELGLGENRLGDEGVSQLSVALKRPSCRLQRLALTMNFFSRATKKKLQAACAAHPQLRLVSFYPPGFLTFPGEGDS